MYSRGVPVPDSTTATLASGTSTPSFNTRELTMTGYSPDPETRQRRVPFLHRRLVRDGGQEELLGHPVNREPCRR